MLKFTIFLILLTITSLKANAAGPEYRDFLVERQPMPAGLLLKQDLASTKTDVTLDNNKTRDLTMYHKKTWLDASPILMTNNPKSFTALGVGYMGDQFDSLQTNAISNHYSGVYASLYAISEINPHWYWNAYLSYGLFSEKNVNASANSKKTFSFATLAYKRNSRQVYKLGIMHNSNFGQDVLLPTLGLSYSRGSYVLDALLPSYLSLRKIHTQKLHSIVKAEFSYASYYDHNQKDILAISGIDTGVVVEYNIYPLVWLHIGGSYASEKQLTWLKSDDDFATIKSGYKLDSGINVRF